MTNRKVDYDRLEEELVSFESRLTQLKKMNGSDDGAARELSDIESQILSCRDRISIIPRLTGDVETQDDIYILQGRMKEIGERIQSHEQRAGLKV